MVPSSSLASVLLLSIGVAACASVDQTSPLVTVGRLDVPRYMGTWYEIAKYPNRFQADCAGGARADYRLEPDGAIAVTNRCRRADGGWNEALGQARPADPADPSRLEVRFAPVWLSWLPAVWGNYWVIDLDPDYQVVAVGEPSRRYLWILARQPTIDPQRYQAVVDRVAAQGYDPTRLQLSPP